MHDSLLALLAAVAGIINLLGFLPYLRDIFLHKTKPERAMWWIYTVLFTVLFAAQVKAGAHWLLLVTGVYIVSAAIVAVLSLWYGYGSFHKRDAVSLIIAVLGLALWLATDKPLLAILMVIVVDAAGFWLTLVKTWHAPHSETLISWQAACLAGVLSLFTIGTWTLELVIYPIYAVLGTGLLVGLIMYRRTKVAEDKADF